MSINDAIIYKIEELLINKEQVLSDLCKSMEKLVANLSEDKTDNISVFWEEHNKLMASFDRLTGEISSCLSDINAPYRALLSDVLSFKKVKNCPDWCANIAEHCEKIKSSLLYIKELNDKATAHAKKIFDLTKEELIKTKQEKKVNDSYLPLNDLQRGVFLDIQEK